MCKITCDEFISSCAEFVATSVTTKNNSDNVIEYIFDNITIESVDDDNTIDTKAGNTELIS
jgi:hypothetical protein